jgi:P4 family phage/plasmid primase-like protien
MPQIKYPEFLKKHAVKKSAKKDTEFIYTHTSLGDGGKPPKIYPGSYNITENELDEFYNVYIDHVFTKNIPAYLTEKHLDNIGPILIDLDFRFDGITEERKYTIETIQSFLKIYFKHLCNLVDIPESNLKTYVMEKPSPNPQDEKGLTKDGIHFVFPNIYVSPNIQYVARNRTIADVECKELFKSIGAKNSIADIFDVCVIERNNWQMYGSRKPNCDRYQITHIYELEEGEINKIDNENVDQTLIKRLSIRRGMNQDIYEMTEDERAIIESEYIGMAEKHKSKPKKKRVLKSKNTKKNFIEDEHLSMVKEIIKILDIKRTESYEDWIRLGWCLHNIDYRLLDDWNEFSKRSCKYVDGECANEWAYMDNDGLGIGTLYRWAKEDNVVEFNKITSKNLNKILMDSLSGTHYDIAKVVYYMFKNFFVCASSRKGIWYTFKNHRWIELDDAIDIKRKISLDVINAYYKLNADLSKTASEMDSTSYEKEIILERCKLVLKVISKLKTNSFKKSVISECSELFHVPKFEEMLDVKFNIIGFENGVYDLERGEFRDGLPEDYMSFTTGIEYEEFENEDDQYIGVKTFLEQVLPKKPVREYVITLLSSFLSGKTGHEKFHIWTGCGGNGKSKLIELFRIGFGDYCCTLPINIITEKRARAEANNPALARTKGKRFACLQEPESNEQINVGLMKELTGGDTIQASAKYKDPIEFKPQFKMVLTCNELPAVNSNDRGTWRRLRLVEFISQFMEDPDPSNPYQFEIDEDLDDKLHEWKSAFMFILIERHKLYRNRGIREPDDVKKQTKDYQNESDHYVMFFNEQIVELGDEYSGVTLKLDDIWFVYQEWFKQVKGSSVKIPPRKDLKKNLDTRFGKCNEHNRYKGIALKNNDDSAGLDGF